MCANANNQHSAQNTEIYSPIQINGSTKGKERKGNEYKRENKKKHDQNKMNDDGGLFPSVFFSLEISIKRFIALF